MFTRLSIPNITAAAVVGAIDYDWYRVIYIPHRKKKNSNNCWPSQQQTLSLLSLPSSCVLLLLFDTARCAAVFKQNLDIHILYNMQYRQCFLMMGVPGAIQLVHASTLI